MPVVMMKLVVIRYPVLVLILVLCSFCSCSSCWFLFVDGFYCWFVVCSLLFRLLGGCPLGGCPLLRVEAFQFETRHPTRKTRSPEP